MSKNLKAVFLMVTLTVSVAVSVLFSIKSNNSVVDNRENVNDISKNEAVISPKTEMESSGSNITVGNSEKYFLVTEGNMLCAYRISSDKREKIAFAELKPLLVEAEDIQKLQSGIYADSYEDLCLYFEAYTS